MPKKLAKDSVIHAYIYQDGSVNAFMTPSGQFFIHIGLIARCYDESTIAAVLAHELAHYYKRHSLDSYIQEEFGNFDGGLDISDKKRNRHSVLKEIEADSLAMIWMKNSNYSLLGILKSLKILEREEQRILGRSEDDWKLKEQTHPLSDERLNKYNDYYKKNKALNSKSFIINEDKFIKFKELAKKESLKSLLDEIKYYDCLELALKFHLMDPDNEIYVHYLMESIRRICYIDKDTRNQNFITNRYYDTLRVDGIRKKREVKRGLFDKLDFNLLPITQEEAKYIKARFYWQGEKKFKTYNEAFEFFNKLGSALNCNECKLSYALSMTRKKDIKLRNKLLIQYQALDHNKYKKYANSLINDDIIKNLSSKKLLVFNEIFAANF